ncbi:MAG: excinuclease ABC subunit UvrC [bacterium]
MSAIRENHSVLTEKLKRIPRKSGVYLLKNKNKKIMYVGKAKTLRSRLRSHFNPGKREDSRHRLMMKQVTDFEVIVTDNEIEALILEANLVKEHHPKFNVNLKDDKSYPYIRITNEEYPRIFVTRKIIKDGSKYFGPYTEAGQVRELMAAVRKIFPVRSCNYKLSLENIKKKKYQVCLDYHIKRCTAPCEEYISRDEYNTIVNQVVDFIRGQNKHLIKDLQKSMIRYASNKKYEAAAQMRDRIKAIEHFQTKQNVIDKTSADRDLITIVTDDKNACGMVFNVREGKLINRQHYFLSIQNSMEKMQVLSAFVKQYYLKKEFIPKEILFPFTPDDFLQLQEWLKKKRGKKVELKIPLRGEKVKLMDMCTRNAELLLQELKQQKKMQKVIFSDGVIALQKDLSLPKPPVYINAFDISNISGKDMVASMVVFENGRPQKSEYRRYKIRSVQRPDDYKAMKEVIKRRMTRLINEKQDFPDLIVVDGGKGQVSAAKKAFAECGINNQMVLGLAKKLEEIYLPYCSDPQILPKHSAGLFFLQRIRDEAHRFAIDYHRKLRKKRTIASELDIIPGVGEKRKHALLKHFSSIEEMRESTVDEISEVKGLNKKVAEKIVSFLTSK